MTLCRQQVAVLPCGISRMWLYETTYEFGTEMILHDALTVKLMLVITVKPQNNVYCDTSNNIFRQNSVLSIG